MQNEQESLGESRAECWGSESRKHATPEVRKAAIVLKSHLV